MLEILNPIISSFARFSSEELGLSVFILLFLSFVLFIAFWRVFSLLRDTGRKFNDTFQQLEFEKIETLRLTESLDQQRTAGQIQFDELMHSEAELAATNREKQRLVDTQVKADTDLKQLNQNLNNEQTRFATLAAQSRAEQKGLEEKVSLLQQNREQLTREFENLANRIFDEKSKRFTESNKQLIDGTLAPLKLQISDFRQKVDTVYNNDSKERHLLKEQIKQLREESIRISEDANNLTRALKHDNKSQGNWGELTLVRALELCGLREPQEYETQVAMRAEDGSKQIPDIVVHLPGGKDVIIDSKVSLLSYTRYFEAETDEQRAIALSQHTASVRTHIKQLSDKSYDQLVGLNTLDYVMLYIPIEGASAMALQNDPTIWSDAYNKNIVLVSPTNLLAILRSVETIWRHERQNKNAEKIALEAGRLHDQFVLYAQSLDDVGKHLTKATQSYEKSVERLSSGRGNLVKRIANLKELGAKTARSLPEHLLDNSDTNFEPDEEAESYALNQAVTAEKNGSISNSEKISVDKTELEEQTDLI